MYTNTAITLSKLFILPTTRTDMTHRRAFSVASPSIWNLLPGASPCPTHFYQRLFLKLMQIRPVFTTGWTGYGGLLHLELTKYGEWDKCTASVWHPTASGVSLLGPLTRGSAPGSRWNFSADFHYRPAFQPRPLCPTRIFCPRDAPAHRPLTSDCAYLL